MKRRLVLITGLFLLSLFIISFFFKNPGLLEPRASATSVLLKDGTLFIAGGHDYDIPTIWDRIKETIVHQDIKYITEKPGELFRGVDSWEIFDPHLGYSTSTGSLDGNHSIIALADGNLLEGDADSGKIRKLLIKTKTWVKIKRPLSKDILISENFVNLLDGRVLILERAQDNFVHCFDIYDPVTDAISNAGSINEARSSCETVVLASGKVLIIGGCLSDKGYEIQTKSCVVYDPKTGDCYKTGDMLEAQGDSNTNALLMTDGRVFQIVENSVDTPSGEYYDPNTGKWSEAPGIVPELKDADDFLSLELFLLKDGSVLAVNDQGCARYDPKAGIWKLTGKLKIPVKGGAYNQLADGRVCVTGGATSDDKSTRACEIYDPNTGLWSLIY